MDIAILKRYIYTKKNLPNSILNVRNCLKKYKYSEKNKDGRLSSAIQEEEVLRILSENFKERIKIPDIRMWYDFLIFDYSLGWLPVNIKITTTKTSDNICNIAGLVHSYTNTILDYDKHYKNGKMSKILIESLKNKNYNRSRRDYYFLVINKNNGDIIANSIRGLTSLSKNVHNLPFQVKWSLNKTFTFNNINKSIDLFMNLFKDIKLNWKTEFMKEIKDLGQYFTKNQEIQEKVKSFVKNKTDPILEPCIGRGDLVALFPDRQVDMYEIDESIDFLDCIDQSKINFCDFLMKKIEIKYSTIILNPPYIYSKNGNLYEKFVKKCFNLMKINGEMIVIIPSDFFKKTNCSKLLEEMTRNGSFTEVYHPDSESLFEYASVNVLVFRYEKDFISDRCLYNDELIYINENKGILSFDKIKKSIPFGNFFDVKVGMVSGKEDVFKQDFGNIDFIVEENKIQKYIYIDHYPCFDDKINKHLLSHKQTLLERKIRKFNENDWFQFGAIRNKSFIEENIGKKCIYISTISRKKIIAFESKVGFFSANLLCILPKVSCKLSETVHYLNSEDFRKNYTYSGKFVIGQRQLESHLIK
jgi:adenine-specific DNA-methyltransferase